MVRLLLLLAAASWAFAEEPLYELSGKLVPRSAGMVMLYGVSAPYSTSTLVDQAGVFHFRKLPAGEYTLMLYSRRRGEARRTVVIGPSAADRKRRVNLRLHFEDSDFVFSPVLQRNLVSARQLAIPGRARDDYRAAAKALSKHDVDEAIKHLEHAVDIAPQFSAAWNNLGTIAYQTKNYLRAEECFREAVAQDPDSFEALVNLGGVLVTLHKLDEAMQTNLHAVLARPNDALANAQMGMTYFLLGQFDLATKYLEHTREIDPAHFSYPQLLLFQIHYQRGEREAAADVLEDFVMRHPDYPQAQQMQKMIGDLRGPSGP